MRTTIQNLAWAAALTVLAGTIILWTPTQAPLPEPVSGGLVTISIDNAHVFDEVPIDGNDTVLSVLSTLDVQDTELNLNTKTYDGLGTLVTGMYGKQNGVDDAYWQYTVNEIMPQVGADAYILANGDQVEWVFAESQF